jgi:hypothetical protein
MKTLIAAAIVTTTISIAHSASAIEITVVKSQGKNPSIVLVEGLFVGGDYVKFASATKELSPGTAVVLNSGGGEISQVIRIGEMIRAKKFVTIAGWLCTSGCAFVWLAGIETPSVPRVVIGLACVRRLLCYKVIRRGFLHQGHSIVFDRQANHNTPAIMSPQ